MLSASRMRPYFFVPSSPKLLVCSRPTMITGSPLWRVAAAFSIFTCRRHNEVNWYNLCGWRGLTNRARFLGAVI